MKCPFLTTRKDILDKDRKKIGEEIILQDCIKNDCMVYDGATKLCSLLSSNMKTGVLIDDVKNGIVEMKEELFQRTESLSVVLSTTLQTLQEALLGRFDILKKQNEVMVLGFDRLVETINNKFEGLRVSIAEFSSGIVTLQNAVTDAISSNSGTLNEVLGTMKEAVVSDLSELKAAFQPLQTSIDDIKHAHTQFSADARGFNEAMLARLSDYEASLTRVNESVAAKLSMIKEGLDKVTTTYQVGMETMSTEVEKIVGVSQSIAEKLGQIDTLAVGITSMSDLVKVELGGLKTETFNSLNNIVSRIDTLSTTIGETMKPSIDAATDLMKTEITGLKTDSLMILGNIANKLDGLGQVFSGELKSNSEYIRGLSGDFNKISETIKSNLDTLQTSVVNKFDELTAALRETAKSQEQSLQGVVANFGTVGETMKTKIGELMSNVASSFDGLKANFDGYFDGVKSEITTLKADQIASFNNVQGAIVQLSTLFKESSDSLGSMSDMMKNLNANYIESLGKIAGLAEGMRKGVAQVGEGMHDSVKDLVKEMKNEIGALEKQYEKTFGDIANLAGKFEGLNKRIKEMTGEVEKEFKGSFDRQEKLSEYTKTILEHIKNYFVKEEARYKDEQQLRKKKEGLDHFDRATLYYYRGNYELAVNEINKALEIEKTAEYLNLKGLLLTEIGKFDESKKTYKEALNLEPNLAEIHNNLGLLYIKMKKLDDAVVAFQEAVKKSVNYARAYVNMGKALIELEKFDDAIKAYERALDIDPANHEAQEALRLYKEGKIGQ